jgi:hypothetical protein
VLETVNEHSDSIQIALFKLWIIRACKSFDPVLHLLLYEAFLAMAAQTPGVNVKIALFKPCLTLLAECFIIPHLLNVCIVIEEGM